MLCPAYYQKEITPSHDRQILTFITFERTNNTHFFLSHFAKVNVPTTYTEEELMLLLKGQNRQAFNYLYKQYSGALYGVIYKVIGDEQTSQDVLQEAFVKIWNNVAQYDAQKG